MDFYSIVITLGAFVLSFIPHVVAATECISYGVDYQNGGEYFTNINSTEFFNFTSFFRGCQEGDVANTVVTLPDTDYRYCSDVPTTPDDTDVTAVCDVDTFEIRKSDMVSGEYIIQLIGNNANGVPFAWQRNVYISAGTQTTVTSTPTVTFTTTSTPEITSTVTSIDTDTVTLEPITTTVPSRTLNETITVTPPRDTVYFTKYHTRTRTRQTFTAVETTKTVPPPCITSVVQDVPCTSLSPKLNNSTLSSIVSAAAVAQATSVKKREAAPVADTLAYRNVDLVHQGLVKRSPDEPIVTVLQNTSVVSVTTTVFAPTSTEYEIVDITTTVTYTPPPVTVASGATQVTVTAPARTKTRTTRVRTTTSVLTTVTATETLTVTAGEPRICGHRGGGRGGRGGSRGRGSRSWP